MPAHEIWKRFQLARRFNHAQTDLSAYGPCHCARHREDQIGVRDGEHHREEEWNPKGNARLNAELANGQFTIA
jgi:hypothetical protein